MERGPPTRLGAVDWAHTTRQPRSRSPSIVDMLKTRNSWLLPPPIVNDAPRTIGRSGFLKADDGRKHTKDEQENPHDNLQSRSGLSRQNSKISGSQTQIAIQAFYSRAFATGRRAALRAASNKKKFQKSQKVFIFNLPLTFAIVRLSIFISFRKTAHVLGPGEFVRASFCAQRVVPNFEATLFDYGKRL